MALGDTCQNRPLTAASWFHGDIERPGSETLLEPQKPGTYLVRVSLTEPEKTPFTISKVGKDGKISHQRINLMKDRSGYYVYLKSSKGQKKIEAQGGLEALINTVRTRYHYQIRQVN